MGGCLYVTASDQIARIERESVIERRTLLEEDHVLGVQAKVVVLLEERLGLYARRAAGHDIPWDHNRARGLARVLRGDGLQAGDPLRLVLEERLVRWQADVVAPLRRAAAQPRPLAPSHEQDTDLAARDGIEADHAPFLLLLWRSNHRVGRVLWEGLDDLFAGVVGRRLLGGDGPVVDAVDALDVEGFELGAELLALIV